MAGWRVDVDIAKGKRNLKTTLPSGKLLSVATNQDAKE